MDPGSVERIEIRRAQDIVSFSRQRDGEWKMSNPLQAKPDSAKVQALLDLLLTKDGPNQLHLALSKDPVQQEASLGIFGITKPVLGVVFAGTFGEQTLWLGEKATSEGDVYARWTQDNYVGLVPASTLAVLNMPVDDLRERRIFYDDNLPVLEVTFQRKDQTLQLLSDGTAILRHGDAGAVEAQIEHRADTAALKEVFEFLDSVSCTSFLDVESDALSSEMLMKIRLERGKGQREETWLLERLSTVAGEKTILSNTQSKTMVAVDPAAFAKYLGDLSWVLDRQWLGLEPTKCRYLSFDSSSEGKTLKFTREEGKAWTVLGASWPVDQEKIQKFVEDLCALKTTTFLACQEMPVQKGLTLRVGSSADKAVTISCIVDHGQYSLHKQTDSFRFLAPKDSLNFERCTDALRWRDPLLWDIKPEDIMDIGLTDTNLDLFFERNSGIWHLVRPRRGDLKQQWIGAALKNLLPLRALRFLSQDTAKRPEVFKPLLKLSLGTVDNKRVLWVGPHEGDGLRAKFADEAEIFVISQKSVAGLLKNPLEFVSMMEEDSNKDGKTDQWVYYSGGRRAWIAYDNDSDGKVDSKTFWRYDRRGNIVRVDTDNNNDGMVDQRTYYRDGKPYRQEDDISGTGRVNVWTTFVDGLQAKQRVDSDNDGKPDMLKTLIRDANGDITGAKVQSMAPGVKDYVENYAPIKTSAATRP